MHVVLEAISVGAAVLAGIAWTIVHIRKRLGKVDPSPDPVLAAHDQRIPRHIQLGGVGADVLPNSQMIVEYAAITQDTILQQGWLTLIVGGNIRNMSPPEQEKKIQENLAMAKKICVDRVLSPRFVPGKARHDDEVSVEAMDPEDIMFLYLRILELSGIRATEKIDQKVQSMAVTECKYIWGNLCKYWNWDPIRAKARPNSEIMEAIDIMTICNTKNRPPEAQKGS